MPVVYLVHSSPDLFFFVFFALCIYSDCVNTTRNTVLHARTYSAQIVSLRAQTVCVEVDVSPGVHSFSVIGLPDKAIDEARERVSAAIKHAGLSSPKQQNQKIVVSLAPGDLKKTGTLFDVPIAIAYLLAVKGVAFDPDRKMFVGELALDGVVQRVRGILPILQCAKKNGFKEVYIPDGNIKEAVLIDNITLIPCKSLKEIIAHLCSDTAITPVTPSYTPSTQPTEHVSFEDIKGQSSVKRALTVAAGGGHNIALYGPPGTGKTLLAKSLISILPSLTKDECVEVTSLHSIAGTDTLSVIDFPPFRSPHHTSSYASIVGGGNPLRPGEISLAHRGVLFLDEFPEFNRRAIESLREPLEEHTITITRASGVVQFPASCILIIAFNLCPCGNTGTDKVCTCSFNAKESYRKKLVGPIADRIDMWISVEASRFDELEQKTMKCDVDFANHAKHCVNNARTIQQNRYEHTPIDLNSEVDARTIETHIPMPPESISTLQSAASKLSLSPRGYHRTVKCARTIADIEVSEIIQPDHILEAVSYRTPPIV